MKKITKTLTMYVAFDGKEFITEAECTAYENRSINSIPMFDVDIPFMSDDDTFIAFYIDSQESFNALVAYCERECDNVYHADYENPKWFFVRFHSEIWAEIHTLNSIMQQLDDALDTINNNVIDITKELKKEEK